MRLLSFLVRILRRLFWSDDATDPREVTLESTCLEPRIVLNASPIAAVLAGDVGQAEAIAPDEIVIDAGQDADDGEADEFHLTTDGSRFHIDVNGKRVHSGDIDDANSVTLRGSSDADQFIIELEEGSAFPESLSIDAGESGASDVLVLEGRSVDTVSYQFESDGTRVDIDGSGIRTTGIDNVIDTLSAHSRHFVYSNGDDNIALADHVHSGTSSIDGVEFASDVERLSIRVVDADVRVDGLDASFDGDLRVVADQSVSIAGEIQTSGWIDISGDSLHHGGSLQAEDVFLEGTDSAIVSGSVDAIDGGSIHVLGGEIHLDGAAHLDASSDSDAGTILIGGDYLGQNADIRNALTTYVGEHVTISADSLGSGDGGRIIVWSDTTSTVLGSGNITARGGAFGGDGGFIETSGKQTLHIGEAADASALNGAAGTWLLDPYNVTIVASGGTDTLSSGVLDPSANDTTIDAADIETALNAGTNVVINTSGAGTQAGDIVVNASITHTSSNDVSLTLNALGSIDVNGAIANTGTGTLDVVLNAVTAITVDAAINTNGGDFTAIATDAASTYASTAHIQTGTGNATISALGSASLHQMTIGGTVDVTAAGISDTGTLTVAGIATLISTGATNDILLDNAANDFGTVILTSADDATVVDTNGLALGASTVAGDLTVTAAGNLTDSGTIDVTGTATFTVTGANNDITLDETANDFATLLLTSADDATIVDTNGLALGASTVGGNLTVTAAGNLTDSGTIDVTGTATFTVTGANNDITLDETANDFATLLLTSADDATIVDTNGLALGASTVAGDLTVTADGNLTDSGILSVTGTATFTVGNGDSIDLDGSTHTLTGAVTFASTGSLTNVAIDDSTVLDLHSLTLGGTLTVSAAGITDSGTLIVTGSTTLVSTGATNDIVLDDSDSNFSTLLLTSANDASVQDTNELALGASTIAGDLTMVAGGSITDSGTLSIDGTASFTVTGSGSDITLNNTANDFNTVLLTSVDNVTLVDANDIVLGASTIEDNLTVTATGSITDGGILDVGGTSSFTVGDGESIDLDANTHALDGTVSFSSSGSLLSAAIEASTMLDLSAVTVTGTLDVTAAGITDSGTISVGGIATFVSTGSSNDIDVDNSTNEFQSTVNLTSDRDVDIRDTTDLILGTTTVGRNLLVRADDDITESGVINVTGTSTFRTRDGHSVLLNTNTHVFTGSVALTLLGNNGTMSSAAITASTSIELAELALDDDLSVTATGITDSGTLSVGGTATFTSTGAANDILLDNIDSNFATAVLNSDGDASIDDTTAIIIGASVVDGVLAVKSDTGITDSGVIQVGGNATFETDSGQSIDIDANTHTFSGSVQFIGTSGSQLANVAVADSTALDLQALDITGDLTVTAAGITDSGTILVDGDTALTSTGATNDIVLDESNSDFIEVRLVSDRHALIIDVDQYTLGTSTIGGDLVVTSGDHIVDAGVVSVTGTTTLTAADDHDIAIDGFTHNFQGAITFASPGTLDDVHLVNGTAVEIGGVSVRDVLQITADGDISESGVITVGDDATFTVSDGSSVLLNTNDHSFADLVTFDSGGTIQDIAVSDADALNLQGVTLSGDLTVKAASITDSGTIIVGGAATFEATSGNITLNSTNSDYNSVGLDSAGTATVVDTDAIELTASTVTSDLAVTADGDITESGIISVGGDSTFTVGSGDSILLGTSTHTFTGSLTLGPTSLGSVAISDSTSVDLHAMTIAGTLDVTATGISNSGDVTVTGITTLTSTGSSNDIVVEQSGNDFSTVILNSERDASVRDTTAIVIGGSNIDRNLAVRSDNGTTDGGVIVVGGDASFQTNNGNSIDLDANTHTFTGDITFAPSSGTLANVAVDDSTAIDLSALTVTGTLVVTSGGTISQSGVLDVGGTAAFTVGDDESIILDASTNTFDDTVMLASTGSLVNVAITDTTSLDLHALALSGTLDVTAAGITDSGTIDVAGVATLTSTGAGNNIELNEAASNYATISLTSANNASAVDEDGVILAASTVAGNLTVIADGEITEAGALVVTGTSAFTVGDGNSIDLDDTQHTLTGAVTFASTGSLVNVAVDNSTSTELSGMVLTGTLSVTSGGTISEMGTLDVAGAATFNAAGGSSILLNTSQHDFGSSVSIGPISGNLINVGLNNLADINLGEMTLSGDLTVVSGGEITESGNLTVGGDASFTAGTGSSISLDTNAHTFTGNVTLAAASGSLLNVAINDSTDFDLNAITLTGSLDVTSGGSITESGIVVVGTTSTFTVGDGESIDLDNNSHTFTGSVTLASTGSLNNVAISDSTSLDLHALSAANLDVTAAGITDSGAIVVSNTATFTATGAGNDVVLDHANNDFATVGLNGGNDVTLVDMNGVTLAASTVGNNLAVTAAQSIADSGILNVTGTSSFTAGNGQSIDLDNNAHSFGGAVAFLSPGTLLNVGIRDTTDITLDAMTLTGTLNVISGGTITENGVLDIDGAASFQAADGSSILLNTNTHAFSNSVSISASSGSLVNVGIDNSIDIELGAMTLSGDLAVVSGGDITESGVLNVGGASSFTVAANGSIDLDANAHTFTGAVTFASVGTLLNVAVDDSTSIDLTAMTVAGTLDVTSGGTITESGVLNVTGAASFTAAGGSSILLNTNTHTFSSAVSFAPVSGNLNDVSIANSASLELGTLTLSGDLIVASGGNITESGVLTIGGTSTFEAATAGTIALNTNTHTFTGAVNFSAASGNLTSLAVADSTSLSLGAMTLTDLTVTAAGISDSGALTITGTTALTSTGAANDIALTQSSDFTTLQLVSGRDASVVDVDNVTLGTSTITGDLTLVTGGDITDSGALSVGGATSLTAGPALTPASITLDSTNNFAGAVSVVRGNAVTIHNGAAIEFGASTVGGVLSVTADGDITESGVLSVAGAATFTANDGDSILLNTSTHSFAGAVGFAASSGTLLDVAIVDSSTFDLGSVALSGDLTISAAGITDSDTVTVGGTATFVSTGVTDVTLDSALSDYSTVVFNSSGNVTANDADDVNLGASSVTGDLTVIAGGNITESGVLAVGGNASFAVGDGDSILLNTNNHTFTGGLAFSATTGTLDSVAVSDSTAVDLSTLTLNGNLQVAAATITNSGALDINGVSTFVVDANESILLDAAGNDFTGSVSLNASSGKLLNVSLTNVNAVALDALDISGNLTVVSGGGITDSGTLVVAGNSSFTAADATSIQLNDAANSFAGTLAFAAATGTLSSVEVTDITAVDLSALTLTGDLAVTAGGGITDSGTLNIGGNAQFVGANNDSVVLDDAANVFGGSLQFSATSGNLLNVTLVDTTAVELQTSNIGGALTVTAGGTGITDSGAISVGGATTLTANAGASIVLDSSNTLSGAVTFVGFGGNLQDVTVVDSTAIDLQALSLDGSLSVTSDGNITDSGALVIAGNVALTGATGTDIVLDSAANIFTGSVGLASSGVGNLGDVTLVDSTAVDLAATTIDGNLAISSGGSITDSGSLVVGGNSSFHATTAGSSVVLDSAGNAFTGTVNFTSASGNLVDVTLVETTAIDLAAITLDGNLSVQSGASISDSGDIVVAGTTTLVAANGSSITVDSSGNTFNGAIALSASSGSLDSVVITDTTDVAIGPLSIANGLTITSGGAITDTGALTVSGTTALDSGTNDITLDDNHDFTIVAISSANNVQLNDINAVSLDASTIAGNLSVATTSGITNAGALDVAGDATFSADAGQSLALNHTGNRFAGTLTFNGNGGNLDDLSIANQLAVGLNTLTIDGDLSVTSDASITDTGVLTISRTAAFDAGAGHDVTLDSSNSFGGSVTVDGQNVTLIDTGSIDLAAATVAGTLNVTATTGITTSGALMVTGDGSFTTGENTSVVLDDAGNSLSGQLAFISSGPGNLLNVTVSNQSAITLQALSIGGNLVVDSDADVSSTGALVVGGATSLTAGSANDISLTQANDFGGSVSVLDGDAVNIHDSNSVSLGSVSFGTSMTVVAGTDGVSVGDVTTTTVISLSAAADLSLTAQNGGGVTIGDDLSLNGGDFVSAGANFDSSTSHLQANDATLNHTGTVFLGSLTLSGDLSLDAGGAVTDAGVLTISGSTTIDAGSGNDVTLDSVNDFGGTVSVVSARDLRLNAADAIDLGASTVAGDAFVSTSGNVTDSADLVIAGLATFTAGTGDITLDSAGNNFASVAITGASSVTLHDTDSIDLQSISLSDTLTVTADDDLSLSQSLTTGSDLSFTAGGNISINGAIDSTTRAVTLNATGATSSVTINSSIATNGSDFVASGVTFNASALIDTGVGAATLTFSDSVTLGQMDVGSTLDVTAGADINASEALLVGGDSSFTSTGGSSISLSNSSNQLIGSLTFNSSAGSLADVTVVNQADTSLQSLTLAGDLSVATDGHITDAGDWSVAGTTTLDAGTLEDITLDAANDFGGSVLIVEGHDVVLNDVDAIDLGDATVTGSLQITSDGAITDSGNLTVSGTTTLSAGVAHDITLDGSNDLGGDVSIVTGNDVTIVDTNALTLGASTIDGSLDVTAAGSITDSGDIIIAGTTTFAASGHVVLDADHDFAGVVAGTGSDITLNDVSAIDLGALTASGSLSVTTGGTISDSGVIEVIGSTTLDAGASNDITLDSSNNFTGAISVVSGNDVTLTDADELILGAATVSGDLTAVAGTDIDNAGDLLVTGDASFTVASGRDIVLDSAGNSFGGGLSFFASGAGNLNDVTVLSASLIDLASLSLDGNLTVTSDSDITDSGALAVAGTTTISTLADFTLDSGGNDFATVVISQAVNATLQDANTIDIGSSSVSGTLTIDAGGLVSDSGTIASAGTTIITTSGDVELDESGNDFATISITAVNATIADSNDLNLGTTTLSGSLTLTAGTTISDSGAVIVAGLTTVTAGNSSSVALDHTSNDFAEFSVLQAASVSVRDASAITLASIATNTLEVTASGNISQSAAVTIADDATFSLGSNDLVLTDSGNDFAGSVVVTDANNVSIVDANDLRLGATTLAGDLTATALEEIFSTAALDIAGNTVITAGSGSDVAFTNSSNDFDGSFSVNSAQDVTVTTADDLQFGSVVIAGNLEADIDGDVSQSSALQVTGTTEIDVAAGHDVVLDDSANQLTGPVSLNANTAEITNSRETELGTVTTTGDFTVNVDGDLTQSGSLSISGESSFDVGSANDITLTDSSNAFTGAVGVVSAENATLVSAGAFEFGNVSVSNSVTVTAFGDVTQSGAIQQAASGGHVTLILDGGDLVLTNGSNQFDGLLNVDANSNDVTVQYTGDLRLGSFDLGHNTTSVSASNLSIEGGLAATGGTIDLTATTATSVFGDIEVDTADLQLVSTTGVITMDAASRLTATSGSLTITAADTISLAALETTSGSVSVTSSVGNIANAGATRNLTTDTGSITLDAVRIGSSGNAISTDIDALTAYGTDGVFIHEVDGLALSDVRSTAGDVEVETDSGSLVVARVSGDTVSLTSLSGTVVDDGNASTDISAGTFSVTATTAGSPSVPLQTDIDNLVATASDLFVEEANGLVVQSISVTGTAEISNAIGDVQVLSASVDDTLSFVVDAGSLSTQSGGTGIIAGNLAIDASDSIGDGNSLETSVTTLAATASGDIDITNAGTALTIGSVDGVSGLSTDNGSIQISQTDSLTVDETVENSSGGDISLTAASLSLSGDILASGGGNVALTATGSMTVDATVSTVGSGEIVPTAGAGIVFTEDGSFDTPTGIARNQSPIVVDLSSPVVSPTGEGSVSGSVGLQNEESFTLTIDWGDGIQEVFPVTNPGDFNYTHQYLASDTQGVSEVTITVIVDYDAAIDGVESTTVTTIAQLPGEGIVSSVVTTTPEPPPAQTVEITAVQEVLEVVSIANNGQQVEVVAVQAESVEAAQTRVWLRVLSENGDELEKIELTENALDNLPGLFERLPDGRYSVSIQEAGDQRERLVMDLNVRGGRAVDSGEQGDGPNRAASTVPADPAGGLVASGNRDLQIANSLGEWHSLGEQKLTEFWQRWERICETLAKASADGPTTQIDSVEPAKSADLPAVTGSDDQQIDQLGTATSPGVKAAIAVGGSVGAWLLARRLLRRRSTAGSDEAAKIAANKARLEEVLPEGPFAEHDETDGTAAKTPEEIVAR